MGTNFCSWFWVSFPYALKFSKVLVKNVAILKESESEFQRGKLKMHQIFENVQSSSNLFDSLPTARSDSRMVSIMPKRPAFGFTATLLQSRNKINVPNKNKSRNKKQTYSHTWRWPELRQSALDVLLPPCHFCSFNPIRHKTRNFRSLPVYQIDPIDPGTMFSSFPRIHWEQIAVIRMKHRFSCQLISFAAAFDGFVEGHLNNITRTTNAPKYQ